MGLSEHEAFLRFFVSSLAGYPRHDSFAGMKACADCLSLVAVG